MNRKSPDGAFLEESIVELERSLGHLQYSAKASGVALHMSDAPSEEQLIQIEAFTSRFARVVDLLSKRVLRAIDQYEMHEPGSLLDIANRAEKRGLIESVEWLREINDMRNAISHDYAGDRLLELLMLCREELPKLMEVCHKTIEHGRRLTTRK